MNRVAGQEPATRPRPRHREQAEPVQTTDVAPTVAALPSAGGKPLRDVLTHPLVLRIVSFAAVLGLWEYAGRIPLSAAFPTFLETARRPRDIAADGSLGKAFLITLKPLLIGLSVSVVLGVGLGVLMGLHGPSEWLIAPIFIIAQAAPLAALIPVLTFAYGIGLTAKVLTVCIMAMPVIVLNTLGAVRNTPQNRCWRCRGRSWRPAASRSGT